MKPKISIVIVSIFYFSSFQLADACTTQDIEFKKISIKTVKECRSAACTIYKGVVVLRNNCSESIGVEAKLIGYNKKGDPISARQMWPNSIHNIPVGDNVFSIDQWLDYDSEIKSFSMQAVAIKKW